MDKTLKIGVQGERGRSWTESEIEGLPLIDLGAKDWHVYDDSYGTDQEKLFIRFLNDQAVRLEAIYKDFFLIRNEKLFKIYAFQDGQAVEPDFVLFLRRADNNLTSIMQLFVEPKGQHLKVDDQWKEDFLLAIGDTARLDTVFQGRDYTVHGLSFFNETGAMRTTFDEVFRRVTQGPG